MGITSFESLLNASQGRMAPRVITAPKPPVDVGFADALSRRAGNVTKLTEGDNTDLYNRVASSPATGGLSSEGKYGGFYSASDQQAAIEGSAINLRENVGPTLQAKAQAYYNKLDPMYKKASDRSRTLTREDMGYKNSSSAANFRMFEETSQNRTAPLRSYAKSLNDWYATQSAPAEQYTATAMQIEDTPLSQLASQIAMTGYGMNPDLATSKFLGLDTRYYNEQEDAKSMATHGMPAAAYKAKQAAKVAAESRALTDNPRRFQAAIESKLQFKASELESATGQTSQQLYEYLDDKYEAIDPDTGTAIVKNGATLAAKLNKYMSAGDDVSAQALIASLTANPTAGSQNLVKILSAMFRLGRVKQKKATANDNEIMAP